MTTNIASWARFQASRDRYLCTHPKVAPDDQATSSKSRGEDLNYSGSGERYPSMRTESAFAREVPLPTPHELSVSHPHSPTPLPPSGPFPIHEQKPPRGLEFRLP